MSGPMLTPTQAAARIGRASGRKPHSSTVTRWIQRGARGRKLPAICQGGRFLVNAADVDAFVLFLNSSPGSAVRQNADAAVSAQLEALLGPNWKRHHAATQSRDVTVRQDAPVNVKPAVAQAGR